MNYAKPEWRDGQPYSPDFDDVYFSADNGVQETEHVFIRHNQLEARFARSLKQHKSFVIAETGFGSGLNFLVSAKYWLDAGDSSACLYYFSVENRPFTPEDLIRAQALWPEFKNIAQALQQQYQAASTGFHLFDLFGGRVRLILMLGEVEVVLQQMQVAVDAWFLDGFAPGLNADMWSEAVFSQIKRLSHAGTTFSTYTAAGIVRRGLQSAGFCVNKVSGCGNKRHMLSGEFQLQPASLSVPVMQPWFEGEITPIDKSSSICIVGAGIAGLTTAWSLVRRGYRVVVLEAGAGPGAQASGNPRGMLMPRISLQDCADAEFYNSAYFYALNCLHQLDEQQLIWQQTGGIQLAASVRIRKQMAEYPQDKALAQVINAQQASDLCGLDIEEAVHYFPLAACVYPQKILHRLIEAMGDKLTIRYHCTVDAFNYNDGQWRLSGSLMGQQNSFDCLILASAWQTRRFKPFDHLYLQPARGQLSLLKASSKSQKLRLPVSYGGYILPANDSQHVAGASFELDDCALELREEEHQSNVNDLNRWFKGLFSEQDICGGRASVRAVTADRVPVVGPAPSTSYYDDQYSDLYKGKTPDRYPQGHYMPGLFVNTGHGARGFSSAFLSAELLVASVCGEPLPVSNRVRYALHPARFLVRSFKKKKT